MKRALALSLVMAACIAGSSGAALGTTASAQRADARPRLVVLDVELTGDLGGPELAPAQEARLKMASALLRDELGRAGLYEVVDASAAGPQTRSTTCRPAGSSQGSRSISEATTMPPGSMRSATWCGI